MPAKEIKELRQAGKLEEALAMAKMELENAMAPLELTNGETGLHVNAPANLLWPKRNISWVYYDFLKQNSSPEHFDDFISWLNKIKDLQLPEEEKMLFDQLAWQVGKMAFGLVKIDPVDPQKAIRLFQSIQSFHFSKPSEAYSFLFKALHKSLKDTDHYLQLADWWDFRNFMPVDFQKEKMPSGKEVMAVAEQAYIAYSKHLLPIQTGLGETLFNREKAVGFLPLLDGLVELHPEYQYPAFYKAKLLLALGDQENMLSALIPFAKKKKNDFWVWDVLSEAFPNDEDKVVACYCKALSCHVAEDFLVNIRLRLARHFVKKKLYPEAKTEITLLVKTRNQNKWKIPNEVIEWMSQDWYIQANANTSNHKFYKKYFAVAESILYYDIPEEPVIVDFVNRDKKILNFIGSEDRFGFFKYDRFIDKVAIGDTLMVRFNGIPGDGISQIYTLTKTENDQLRRQFVKNAEGILRIPTGKSFGFIDDVFVHPSLINCSRLMNGQNVNGLAIKTYNKDKRQWGWKLFVAEKPVDQ